MSIRPRKIQEEALFALDQAIGRGDEAGLVVMATGLGKTVLAALFDSEHGFEKTLFVAHRSEILRQTESEFKKVFPKITASYFDAEDKDLSGDLVLASVQTIARRLDFDPRMFDLVVVDEFHHAAAASYRKLIEHVHPEFLLGLTATPWRTDRQDIMELCGNNEVFHIDLYQALCRKLVCPVHYFGIEDSIDFKPIPWTGSQYKREVIEKAVETKKRTQQSYDEWRKHGGERTLAFCQTVRHAQFTCDFFRRRRVKAVVVHGGTPDVERQKALQDLTDGTVQVVFSVDVFGEGVDVPDVDTILMLRPTRSRIVWYQQAGRGLRKARGKKGVTIIDFVGNDLQSFKHLENVREAITGKREGSGDVMSESNSTREELPEGCAIDVSIEARDALRVFDRSGLIEKAIELDERGMNSKQIAKEVAVHFNTVTNWLKRKGHREPRKKPENIKLKALRRARKGEPIRAIAQDMGLSSTNLKRWCVEANIVPFKPKRFSPAQKRRAVKDVRKGMTVVNAARKHQVGRKTLETWCRLAGISPLDFKAHRRQKGLALLSQGLTVKQVAARLGVSTHAVYLWRKKAS